MTPLPRAFSELQPNVLIARCSQCHRLAFASELCTTQQALAVCPNRSEPQNDVGAYRASCAAEKAPLARPAL